jgi:hypothetical protein
MPEAIEMSEGVAIGATRRWYGRKDVSELLKAHGYPVPVRQLEKMATAGDGPPYRLFARKALYAADEALAWAESRLTAPRRHTSEGRANAA